MASISLFTRGKSGGRSELAQTKWQMEPGSQLHEHSRQGFAKTEFPSFQGRRARGRKRGTRRRTHNSIIHGSWSCATRVLCLARSCRHLKQQPQISEKQQEFS